MLKDGESFLPPAAKASITIAWIKWVYPIDSLWQYTMPYTQRDKMCLLFSHRDTRTAYWFLPWKGSKHAIHGLQSKRFFTPNSKLKQQRRMLIQTSDKFIFNYKKGSIYWLVGGWWSMLTDLVDAYLTTVEHGRLLWSAVIRIQRNRCHFLGSVKILDCGKDVEAVKARWMTFWCVNVLNAMHKFNIDREACLSNKQC